ncbi:MAG TPA: ribosome maturation factor RimP [bacterium]|nr:ribosome maturation factor RimP [bacterium]
MKRVEELLEPVLSNMGYELVERELATEGGRPTLRLYIDKEGGVTIDDCAAASRGVEDLLEVEDVMPSGYNLEVSSPGIDRPLRRRKDFERYCGSRVRIRTFEPIEGRGNFKGTLERLDGDEIVMEVDGRHYRIPFGSVAKARLDVEKIPPKSKSN